MTRRHWAALLGVGALGIGSLAGARHEEEGFSNESLEGTWGYIGQFGVFVPPVVEEPTPAVTIGMIEFDGDGGCSVRGLINTLGSTAELDSSECEYSVEPNGWGTGLLRADAPLEGEFSYAFVLRDGGEELLIMNTELAMGTLIARRR